VGGLDIGLFVAGTFLTALVAGVSGFAFGLIAASVWLYVLAPLETTILIAVFGVVVQGYAVWQLRHALRPARLWPFLLGGAIGVPIGAELLRAVDPTDVRRTVGALLMAFAVYSVARPTVRLPTAGGRGADGAVGLMSGVVGAITGFAGILTVVWSNMRGWPRDEQRAVFQPVGVAIFVLTVAWLGGRGAVSAQTVSLMAIGAPALLLGVWAGLKLYGRLDEAGFRKVVLALLFLSGVVLLTVA
jgi:uncharacterized membrane protein YfcA